MHYIALVGNQEREIDISEVAPERYLLNIEGRSFEVDARQVGAHGLSLVLGSQSVVAELERRGTVYHASIEGQHAEVEVLDLRRLRLRRAQQEGTALLGPIEVHTPMPGKIVAVLVHEGDAVQAGQGLIVVEAMKMENELRAPKAGTVRSLKACAGTAVESGLCLCVID